MDRAFEIAPGIFLNPQPARNMVSRFNLRNKKHRLRIREINQQRSAPEGKISGQHEEFVGPPGNPGPQILLLEKIAYLLCARRRRCSHEACTHDRGPHSVYMIPYFSNALTALLPSSMAFFTSFSPRAFSSARVKTSVSASAGTNNTPSMSPKIISPGRTRTAPISTGMRKSTTL